MNGAKVNERLLLETGLSIYKRNKLIATRAAENVTLSSVRQIVFFGRLRETARSAKSNLSTAIVLRTLLTISNLRIRISL